MTLKQFYISKGNNETIIYIKGDKETYKLSDLNYDDLESYIVNQSFKIEDEIYFCTVTKKKNSDIENFKLDAYNRLHEASQYMYEKYCKGNTCTDCSLNFGINSCSCYFAKLNALLDSVKRDLRNYKLEKGE